MRRSWRKTSTPTAVTRSSGGRLPTASARSSCYHRQALEDFLPNELPPEQVRTALTACIRKVTEHPAMFDVQGWLQPGVYGCQPDLAEEFGRKSSSAACDSSWNAPKR